MKWKNKTKGGYDVRIYANDVGCYKDIHGCVFKTFQYPVPQEEAMVAAWTLEGCLIEDTDAAQMNDDGDYDLVPEENEWLFR